MQEENYCRRIVSAKIPGNDHITDTVLWNLYVLNQSIMLAHAKPEDGVCHMGVQMTVFRKPVEFPNDHHAKIIFVLAAEDQEKHLNMLNDIFKIVSDTELCNKIAEQTSPEGNLIFTKSGIKIKTADFATLVTESAVLPVSDSDGRAILFAHHLFLLLLEFPEIIFPYIGPFMGGAVIDPHIFLNGRMLPDRVGQIFFAGQRIDLTNRTGARNASGIWKVGVHRR